ncbi:MAG: RNA polymerase sigma factor [Victivallaceae bacterium]
MTVPKEAEIIIRVLSGNIDEFELLVESHKGKVFSIVRKRVPPDDAEEVAQKVFIAAFKALGSFSRNKPFENWLSGIAVRSCCNYWRECGSSRKMLAASPDGEQFEWLEKVCSSNSIEKFAALSRRSEAKELVEWCLGKMPPEDRALLEMIYFEEWLLKDAAAAMGWGLAKTKIRAMRAKAKMKQIISKLPGGSKK